MAKSKNEATKTVERHKFSSRVDIIIPFHGQYERVTRLIESLFRYTFSNVYQLILVDDASPNEIYSQNLSSVPGINCVRLEEQKGFGGAIRKGFDQSEKMNMLRREKDQSEHAYVVFIQSDCVVEDVGWLKSLGESLLDLKPQGVRMVGSVTNNPMTGDSRQKAEKGSDAEDVVLTDSHLGMHCFMVHRDLFRHVGGFVKEYPYGNYEDEEFAYRLRKYGFKQGISSQSFVKHAGGATFKDVYRKDPAARASCDRNRDLCVEDVRRLQGSVAPRK